MDWDVTFPPPPFEPPDVVLHAAAWTDVDGAEDDPLEAAAVNVGGTRHVADLGVPLVYFSTDYVFDGRKGEPYVESDAPNPLSAYGRTKVYGEGAAGDSAWIVRSSGLYGPSGKNFVRAMLDLARERDEVAVVDDQRTSPTYVGHLSERHVSSSTGPSGSGTSPRRARHVGGIRRGDLRRSGPRHACAADLEPELGRPAAAAPYSVLRSEKAAPALPHWREGLGACLPRLAGPLQLAVLLGVELAAAEDPDARAAPR